MYNLTEYSDNYSETSGSLWHGSIIEMRKMITRQILNFLSPKQKPQEALIFE